MKYLVISKIPNRKKSALYWYHVEENSYEVMAWFVNEDAAAEFSKISIGEMVNMVMNRDREIIEKTRRK